MQPSEYSNGDKTVQAVEKLSSFAVSDATPVFADFSQVTPVLPARDRGLVLNAAVARKSAPLVKPVLTVTSFQQKTKNLPIQRRLKATPAERAVAPRTGGVKLPRSEFEMLRHKSKTEKLRVNSEPEKLRVKSDPEKFCGQSLQKPSVVTMPFSAVSTPASTDTQTTDLMEAVQGLQEELARQQRKFSALYAHTRMLAQDIERKDEMLQLLKRGDCAQKLLSVAQTQLAISTAALHAKNISGEHKLVNKVTNPSKVVQAEVDKASVRMLKQHQLEQREDVARLVGIVDELATKYPKDRYSNISTIIENPMQHEQKEDAISVTTVFRAICLFADEPTALDLEKFDEFLDKETRPEPIFSPSFPKPRVQWCSLNANYLRNMPKPEAFPVQSCSPEHSFYSTKIHTNELCDGREFGAGKFVITHDNPMFEKINPFGTLYGFITDVGVLPVPEESVHGYTCVPETGVWVIAARGG